MEDYKKGEELAKSLIELWNSLPDDTKRGIKKKFDVHHGEIGVPFAALGYALCLSEKRELKEGGEFLKGFGETLITDDIQDIDKWFRPRHH